MSKSLLLIAATALLIASGESKKIHNSTAITQAMEEFEHHIFRCRSIAEQMKERELYEKQNGITPTAPIKHWIGTLDEEEGKMM